MNPTISVIMPAYNCGPYIRKAIESILNQTFSDFELVICDDASNDDTWNQINSFEDERIRKFKNEQNLGYLKNYNFLLTLVKGSFITCQDADDWSESTRLEEQINIFHQHPEIALAGISGGFYYDDKTIKKCPPFQSGYVTTQQEIQPFILPAILFRKEVLLKVKGFHNYFDRATSMDQYFIFNILSYFKGYAIDKYMYTHRFNTTSNSRTLDNFRKVTAHEAYLFLRKQRLSNSSDWLIEGRERELLAFEESLLKDRIFMAKKFREFAVYKIDSGNLYQALQFLLKAFTQNPFYLKNYRTLLYWIRKLASYKYGL